MWIREIHGLGFMHFVQGYERVLLVGTGSGIAPIVPYLENYLHHCKIHILWTASKPKENYGPILQLVEEKKRLNQVEAIIMDSSIHGRTDLSNIIKNAVKKSQAQAVFIVANAFITKQVLHVLGNKAIAVYGATWDS